MFRAITPAKNSRFVRVRRKLSTEASSRSTWTCVSTRLSNVSQSIAPMTSSSAPFSFIHAASCRPVWRPIGPPWIAKLT